MPTHNTPIDNRHNTERSSSAHEQAPRGSGGRIIALLLAGGVGSRFSAMRPKQYIEVEGQPIITYTMDAFEKHSRVTDIYVVCMDRWTSYIDTKAKEIGISKFRGCLPSGETSFESMRKGISGLIEMGYDKDSIVLVHDSVRPLISHDTISSNIEVCRQNGNAITVVYSNEAYMHVNGTNAGDGYAARDEYMRAQTPHTFRLSTLEEMFSQASAKGIQTSQSLFTLANELGQKGLFIAQGDILNFKITKPQDLFIFKAILRQREEG